MPKEYEQENIPGIESEALNPAFIAQIASRLFNEVPEAGTVPRYETDAAGAPSSVAGILHDKTAFAGEPGAWNVPTNLQQQDFSGESAPPYLFDGLPAEPEHDFYFLPGTPEKKQEPLGHHANKLTDQQNYSENTDGSYGLDQFIQRSLPPKPDSAERFSEANPAINPQAQLPSSPGSNGGSAEGQCYAEKLYRTFEQEQGSPNLEAVFQKLRGGTSAPAGVPELPGGSSSLPFSMPEAPREPYYFLREPKVPIHQPEGFDVLTIRKDFPVLHQKIHGKQLVWFDNAATTQKPLSVINAVAQFYANDNSNIHRGAHTLAARATDAYEGAREKIRQFIGAGSASEIIYVRGTTEGINLVAQTWGRKFVQPGDEIVLSILEHHANKLTDQQNYSARQGDDTTGQAL